MSTLAKSFSRSNLERAWGWIKSNPNASYKSYCGPAYSRYALADASLLEELRDELVRGIYEPTPSTKVFLPKQSGILRPYTILTVEDQIVYQAMVNTIAERLAPRIRHQYLRSSFGHMYAGKSSIWFYKPWKQGYSAFNKASRRAFRRGMKFAASFDLTACYDSLDHLVLSYFLRQLKCDKEFCEKLITWLGVWAATDTKIYHSHGIPQGPLSSGLLSEVVLRHFDLNCGMGTKVRYLRYVDDIRLFASSEDALRRVLINLDILSKDVGLFPQAAKINIHEIRDIEDELKSISAPYETDDEDEENEQSDQAQLRVKLLGLSQRCKVENNTKFKFLLSRAEPSSKLNSRLLKISSTRPDLIQNIMRYFRKYDRLPVKVAGELLDRLAIEPLYENTTTEIISTLDKRTPVAFHGRAVRSIKRLWRRRKLGAELQAATGTYIFREGIISEDKIRYFLSTKVNWWVRSELYGILEPTSFGTVFLANILNQGIRDTTGDAALSAAARLAYLDLKVRLPSKDLNLAAARTLRQLGIISKLPKGVDGVERSLSRFMQASTGIKWRAVFKHTYKQAEKQAVFCRALADTNPTAFVNAADVFNDLFLSSLYRHDPSLGIYTLGNVGSILTSVRFKNNYPAIFGFVSEIHEKRLVSSLSHAVAKRTGKPTGRIKYKYVREVKYLMRQAFVELANTW